MERSPEKRPPEDFSHMTDEDWALHEGQWGFSPEEFPLRELNESGSYDVVYYDSNYNPVRSVPITPDGRIDTSREAAQQPDNEVLPQDTDTDEPPAPPTPEA